MGKVSRGSLIIVIISIADSVSLSLVYPGNIKDNLMQYMYSSNYIADKDIDPSVVGCNRLAPNQTLDME